MPYAETIAPRTLRGGTLAWASALWTLPSLVSAACSPEETQAFLDQGFNAEQVVALCGEPAAAPLPGDRADAPAGPSAVGDTPPINWGDFAQNFEVISHQAATLTFTDPFGQVSHLPGVSFEAVARSTIDPIMVRYRARFLDASGFEIPGSLSILELQPERIESDMWGMQKIFDGTRVRGTFLMPPVEGIGRIEIVYLF